ncbi:DUF1080 domain-containing protein [Verrucomicrobiaceae bacterium R5-34]|uniref:DUF1080 domain-containing protein n=1 Tax=Oceaniferula flava TaxID=2800421 RepID=A0AAE2SCY5_9BACT|nr:DUF1080 domain-containing protein [Oceaniferula flavus]MBK1831062.1 DUF1080 domain-containing protein [Verrucomicrobiaceae bacterium R5-34]MBK1855578.1 DUF1080 domain-containing protein [Oceaniferula flavus]MBM1136884.1 DUF1080 domain-containing protein [Oceaniferula flavus]
MKITICCLAAVCTPMLGQAKEEAVSLFNGKDLTGWKGEGYAVKDGAIVCTPKGTNLMTEKVYSNYIFEFEFKLPPGGNNGIGIHYPGEGNPAYVAMEVQVLDNTHPKYAKLKDYQFHGGLYTLKAAKKGHLKPLGEWNKETITVNGNTITVELNGTVINEANLDTLSQKFPKHEGVKRRSGHIAFCGHGDPVQFRGMKVTELPSAINANAQTSPTALPAPQLEGFTPLYNGKDLSGWKNDPGHAGHWQTRGEVLHYDGKSTAKDKNLWTAKEYGDVVLAVDWRWAAPASKKAMRPLLDPKTGEAKLDAEGKPIIMEVDELDSGIYFRGNNRSQVNLWNWPGGSGEVYGYRTNKKHPQAIRAALTPSENADNAIGEWNRTLITLKGDRLTVVLNGKTVISEAQLPGVPEKGAIALQHHGSAIEFANIAIKEL